MEYKKMEYKKIKVLPVIMLAVLLFLSACGGGDPEKASVNQNLDLGRGPNYAGASWVTVHGDSRNSDYSPFVAVADLKIAWAALDGASMAVGPTIGPEGNLYATTGQGQGTSHFHVYDRDGNLLWESPVMQSLDDLDYGAWINATVIDSAGDVYVADLNQLWAYHPDGELKWVANLSDQGASGQFVTPVISIEGHVGGITTDGKVIFYDRNTGELVWSVLDLPGVPGTTADTMPSPGLLQGGLLEPTFAQPMWDLVWGKGIEVANTPAVHPVTGRLFITAGGATSTTGALYGIDTGENGLSIAFNAPMGGGSGTSPAISPDGSLVYAADDDGVMFAFDGYSGEVVWTLTETMAAASPAVGPDGTIYSYSDSNIVAISGTDGSVKWNVDYDSLAAEFLAPLDVAERIVKIDCVLVLSAKKLWAAIDMDYEVLIGGNPAPVPQISLLTAIDPSDGSVLGKARIRDTCGAIIAPDKDGRVYISLGSFASSIMYYGLGSALPEAVRIQNPPQGGFLALEPVSYTDYIHEAIEWVLELIDGVSTDISTAATSLDICRAQLTGTMTAFGDAVEKGEISRSTADTCREKLSNAETLLNDAVTELEGGSQDVSGKLSDAERLLEDLLADM